jgi:cell division transport system permease protein
VLNKLQGYLGYHVQAAINSLFYMWRQPLATGMTIMVIAITLTLPALFWVVNDNLEKLAKNFKQGGQISLYLDLHTSANDSIALLSKIKNTDGVGSAVLKTPAEGLQELEHQEGMQDLMLNLPENPLPAVIDVTPALSVNTPTALEALFGRLKQLQGIEAAKLDLQWVSRLFVLLDVLSQLSHGVMLLLGLAVIFIIGNTLRLVIHRRYEEIQVLKLIGASDAYILRPFLYLGIWHGLMSALLAVILLALFMFSMQVVLNQLIKVYQLHISTFGLSVRPILGFCAVATGLGWLGASFSVKRQLAKIEP